MYMLSPSLYDEETEVQKGSEAQAVLVLSVHYCNNQLVLPLL